MLKWKLFSVVILSACILAPDVTLAAQLCSRTASRNLIAAASHVESAERTFENSRIKDMCRAGRRLIAELHRAESVIKSNPKCTLVTSGDRRAFARLQSLIRQVDREFKKGC